MITGVVGVLMMPWKLLGDFSAYISAGWSATPACSVPSPAS